ncbi:hypothetical protein DFH06DRAFT_1040145 [Mycena polygramma]|nr:hypothetical protein DFH06DRAFT_1040145 [Mycena polygramma]
MSTDPDYACSLNSFDSANINVVVEGNQYTIHRFFLARDSPVLREKFSTPVGNKNAAYTLEGITKEELEHLLWVYYNPLIEHYLAPIAVWRDALKLADMWKMDRIKEIALGHLLSAELDPIERIQLCEHDGVNRYNAKDAYIKICTREESLTPAEFQALGMDVVLLVMQIRERILASRRDQPEANEVNIGNIVDNAIGVTVPYPEVYCVPPNYC